MSELHGLILLCVGNVLVWCLWQGPGLLLYFFPNLSKIIAFYSVIWPLTLKPNDAQNLAMLYL